MKFLAFFLTILINLNINAQTLFKIDLNNIKLITNNELEEDKINKPNYDENGFDEIGIHKDTNTYYDPSGLDKLRDNYNVECNERSLQNSFNYSRYTDCNNTAQYSSFIYFNGDYIGAGINSSSFSSRTPSSIIVGNYKYSYKSYKGLFDEDLGYPYFRKNYLYEVCREINN